MSSAGKPARRRRCDRAPSSESVPSTKKLTETTCDCLRPSRPMTPRPPKECPPVPENGTSSSLCGEPLLELPMRLLPPCKQPESRDCPSRSQSWANWRDRTAWTRVQLHCARGTGTVHLAVTECLRGDAMQIRSRGSSQLTDTCRQHWTASLQRPASHEETKDESKYSSNSNQATRHRARPASRTRRNLRSGRRCGSTDFAMAVTLHQRQAWQWVSLNTNTAPRKNRCHRSNCSEIAARSERRHQRNTS